MNFDKERENTHTAVNEKRKTETSWTLFYNRLFCKALLKINHLFYLASSFTVQVWFFDIRMTQKISKGGIVNGK